MQGCRPFSDSEYRSMLGAFEGRYEYRDRALFVLGVMTGLRVSSLLSLRLGDVWRNGLIVEFVKIERRHMKGKRKGHTVVLNRDARQAVADWINTIPAVGGSLKPEAALFQSKRGVGRAIGYRQALHIVQKTAERAGVDTAAVATHSWRKTAAKLMFEETDGDYRSVQELLGHENINSTIRYLELNREKVNAAVLSMAERLREKREAENAG